MCGEQYLSYIIIPVYHCKNVRVISTLSQLAHFHLFGSFYNSPSNESYHSMSSVGQAGLVRLIRQTQYHFFVPHKICVYACLIRQFSMQVDSICNGGVATIIID